MYIIYQFENQILYYTKQILKLYNLCCSLKKKIHIATIHVELCFLNKFNYDKLLKNKVKMFLN